MKIAFSKVGRSPAEFRYTDEGMTISGTLLREGAHQVALEARVSGDLSLFCDRCGAEFQRELDFPLELTLTDRPEKISDNLDTIEFPNGEIDIAAILESERASYRSAYHYCAACEADEGEIDIEY